MSKKQDPDPYQNDMDSQHWFEVKFEEKLGNSTVEVKINIPI